MARESLSIQQFSKYLKTRCLAYHYLSPRYHYLHLVIGSYGYTQLFQVGLKGVKKKVGLLNKNNKTSCLANHYLSTSYNKLQPVIDSYGKLSYFKLD